MTEVLVRTEHVSRRFGAVVAVDDVTLDVHAGEVVGVLGPNGAGKSTLFAMLTGLRRPTSGRVELFGGDPTDARNRRGLGVTSQESGTPPMLRVREVVTFVAKHYPDPAPVDEILDRFDLGALARRQTGGLSGGQQRRLAVALAFVGRPRLVILDEPTTGLDVESRHGVWESIMASHEAGMTVLMSSHYLEEVERLAQRVVVLGAGRVIADDTVAAVQQMVDLKRIDLDTPTAPPLELVSRHERNGAHWTLWALDSDAFVRDLVRAETPYADLRVRSASLEDAFLSLTRDDVAARDEAARPNLPPARAGAPTMDEVPV